MPMKILGAGALLMAGWFWFYLFVRQFLFNFFTAYPLIKGMQAANRCKAVYRCICGQLRRCMCHRRCNSAHLLPMVLHSLLCCRCVGGSCNVYSPAWTQ